MPQSSLMAWLNKPRAVLDPGIRPEQQAETTKDRAGSGKTTDDEYRQNDDPKTSPDKTEKNPSQTLPPNVELKSCQKDEIPHLKRLTSLLLPIPYSDKFFREIVDDSVTNDITLLAVWHDDPKMKGQQKGRLVGAIRCRLLAQSPAVGQSSRNEGPMLYLSTLVLLSPYRSHGIATHLLQNLTRRAIQNYGISSVGAHVWEANQEGLEWYRKRGFCEVNREAGYYRRLDPQGAVVMQRSVTVTDLLGK